MQWPEVGALFSNTFALDLRSRIENGEWQRWPSLGCFMMGKKPGAEGGPRIDICLSNITIAGDIAPNGGIGEDLVGGVVATRENPQPGGTRTASGRECAGPYNRRGRNDMGALTVIPRWQQLTQFMEVLRAGRPYERRTLFERLTNLNPKEVDGLLYNGLCSIDAPIHDWEGALADMESLGIESGARDTLLNLQLRFPCGQDLSVEVFPMDPDDTFGRGQLGGVSGWVNWAGTTISLVVYPAAETLSTLLSTTVHEYHHHYRMAVMNNGHDRISLLETIIREGLAEHFVAKVLGDTARGPYAEVLSQKEAHSLWTEVYRDRIFLRGEDHTSPYQFGGGTSGLPLWAGYSVGYHLVSWYREAHPGLSVLDLTRLDAGCFIPHE